MSSPMRLTKEDQELIAHYRAWSEQTWAADFMHPFPDVVGAFIRWLDSPTEQPLESYESEFLAEHKRQREGRT